MALVLSFYVVSPALAEPAIIVLPPPTVVVPAENVPTNVEWSFVGFNAGEGTEFSLFSEGGEAVELRVERISDSYVRVAPVETLLPLTRYTLSEAFDTNIVSSLEVMTRAESDLVAPEEAEISSPEVDGPGFPFGTNTGPYVGDYRYRFSMSGSGADAVLLELRSEATDAFIQASVLSGELPIFAFFYLREPVEGRHYIELVDAAGNRILTNSVDVSAGCSSAAVPSSELPLTAFALFGLLVLGRRGKL